MRIEIGSWRRNLIALGIFLAFYFAFGILLTVFQERIIYLPDARPFNDCPALENAERVEYEGTRLYVLGKGNRVAVIYHGNAGSACDRASIADAFASAGYSVVVPEYAGYSGDDRAPTHEAIREDARHVVDYLATKRYASTVVLGESIGTGLASLHASIAPPDKLILVSPFTDLAAVARHRFWFYPTSFLVDNAYDNRAALREYGGSVLILHGTDDAVIPYELGEQLFASLPAKAKAFLPIEGAGHNDMYANGALDSIGEFIR